MPTEQITIKTTPQVHRAIKIIAADRGLKQYEVMEVLLEIMNKADSQLVFELFARKAGDWKGPEQ